GEGLGKRWFYRAARGVDRGWADARLRISRSRQRHRRWLASGFHRHGDRFCDRIVVRPERPTLEPADEFASCSLSFLTAILTWTALSIVSILLGRRLSRSSSSLSLC